ncbi:Craniofacial development protein 1 [Mortierella claussenii]|nr:Craniofacial development protein 1 [Mortierella claussenii]
MTKLAAEKPIKPDVESDSDSSDDEDYVPDGKSDCTIVERISHKADIQSDGEDDSDDSDTEKTDYAQDEKRDEFTTTRSGKRRATGSFSSGDSNKRPKPEDTIGQAEAEQKKNRLDALWAELNAPVSKPTSRPGLLAAASIGSESGVTSNTVPASSGKMVTITTTYDFAGETVTVTKDVPEDSKEAKEYTRKSKAGSNGTVGGGGGGNNDAAVAQSISTSEATTVLSSASSLSAPNTDAPDSILSTAVNLATELSDSTSNSSFTPIPSKPASPSGRTRVTTRPSILDSLAAKDKKGGGPVRYVRKKSNLDELAATYGVKKPPKMNTLEKSKLDWKNFVGKEGIEDELKHHNKDGYMEKVAFLQRTDERRDLEYQALKKRK